MFYVKPTVGRWRCLQGIATLNIALTSESPVSFVNCYPLSATVFSTMRKMLLFYKMNYGALRTCWNENCAQLFSTDFAEHICSHSMPFCRQLLSKPLNTLLFYSKCSGMYVNNTMTFQSSQKTLAVLYSLIIQYIIIRHLIL